MTSSRLFCVVILAWAVCHANAASLLAKSAWIRSAPTGSQVFAGYAALANAGEQPIRITGARSARFDAIEIHRSVSTGGVMQMRRVDALDLLPGATLELAPGGLHLMLMKPRGDVSDAQTIVIDLLGAEGEVFPTVFTVRRESP